MYKPTLKSFGIGKDDTTSHINDVLNPNDQHLGSAPSTGNGHLNPIDEQKGTVPNQSPGAQQESDYPYQKATVTAKDLCNIRFLANNSILVGDKILSFPWNTGLYTTLTRAAQELYYAKDDTEIEIWGDMNVEVVSPNSVTKTAKTFHEMFSYTLDCFMETKSEFFGKVVKVHGDDESVLILEMFELQDALYFAMKDWPGCTNPKDVFVSFLLRLDDWWPQYYCNASEALEMLHEFFDRYYPTVANKM